jgi:hypothetical protein
MTVAAPAVAAPAVAAILLLSLTLIGLQLALMRAFAVVRYSHFSYLVIGTALLGFGASGTFLTLAWPRLEGRFAFWSLLFLTLFTLSIPVCVPAALRLPLDLQYLFYSGRELLRLALTGLLLLIPFFLGATVIGMALAFWKDRGFLLYGASLLGSGLGGPAAFGLMFLVPAAWLPLRLAPLAGAAILLWALALRPFASRPIRAFALAMVLAGAAAGWLAVAARPEVRPDPYKSLSHLQRLEAQGSARRLLTRHGPRGQIDVYASETLHQSLFAGLNAEALPPGQLAVLVDGMAAGTVFRTDRLEDTGILDSTPQSLAYRLVPEPKVLLLGETGGTNVWLARRFASPSMMVVQNDPRLLTLLERELAAEGGGVLTGPRVRRAACHPRLFIEQSGERFDLIQIVPAEGMPAGAGGLAATSEDYLLTAEAVGRCLKRLSPRGMVAFTRGIQTPPRDNLKIFALFAEAARRAGLDPGRHLLQGRNYLAVTTLLAGSPIDEPTVAAFRRACDRLLMDAEYYPGIRSEELSPINQAPGPPGTRYSWYHHGAMEIVSGRAGALYRGWAYRIEPPTDRRPYFHHFFRWRSLGRLIEAYGPGWFQRLELGYLVLVFTLLEVSLLAFLLILLPLGIRRGRRPGAGGPPPGPDRLPALLYFAALGFGFMFLEMVFLQRFTRLLGDPLSSASTVLTSLLVFAGIGSLAGSRVAGPRPEPREAGRSRRLLLSRAAKRLCRMPTRRIRQAAALLLPAALLAWFGAELLGARFLGASRLLSFAAAAALLAPMSLLLGLFFPAGLAVLRHDSIAIVPWAWAVNGFASVCAAPLAVLLSMSIGLDGVAALAVGLYLGAGQATRLWRGGAS